MAYVLLRCERIDLAGDWIAGADPLQPDAFTAGGAVFPDDAAAVPASVCFGEAGVRWVGALAAHARGDAEGLERDLARFLELADSCPMRQADVVSGAAGLLLAAAALVEQLAPSSPGALLDGGERIATRLTQLASAGARLPPGELGWLGAAHGWGGIAHALLRWSQATGTGPGQEVRDLLAALRATRLPTGLWPRHTSTDEVWPGWCHGSAGWAQLWTLVHEVTGDDDALHLAEGAAAEALTPTDAGPGLCCGQAGIAYAALALHRSTGDDAWLDAARRLAAQAAEASPGPSFPEDSLWQGDLGVALLLIELDDPSSAAMPLYGQSPSC